MTETRVLRTAVKKVRGAHTCQTTREFVRTTSRATEPKRASMEPASQDNLLCAMTRIRAPKMAATQDWVARMSSTIFNRAPMEMSAMVMRSALKGTAYRALPSHAMMEIHARTMAAIPL